MHALVRRTAATRAVNRPATRILRRLLSGRSLHDLASSPLWSRAVRFPITDEFFAVDVDGVGTIELHARSLPFLYWGGLQTFEPDVLPLFRELVRDCETFVDVGANVGVFALLAHRLSPRTRITAVEPNPELARILRETVARNGAPVTVVEAALADEEGEIELALAGGLSSIVPARVPAETPRARVNVTTFDTLFPEGADLVKIDVEGAEALVLRGMERALRTRRPTVICEVAGGNLASVAEAAGPAYRVLTLPERVPATEAAGDVNVVLEPAG